MNNLYAKKMKYFGSQIDTSKSTAKNYGFNE